MAKVLTAAAVERYRAGTARREIRDAGAQGLHLIIQTSGHKSWALRLRRPGGKPAKLTLGPVDISGTEMPAQPVLGQPLTLAAARALASEIQRERAMGGDVIADRAAAKHRRRAEVEEGAANTFAVAAKDFIEQYASKKQRRWFETARLLGLDPKKELEVIHGGLCERWHDKPVAKIDGHDIFGLLEETRSSGVPGLERRGSGPTESRARALLAALSILFTWLVQRRRVAQNPCIGVHRPDPPSARDRVLTNAEIVTFWSAASAERKAFGGLLKLLLLTGCRLNEVAGMRRDEMSEDGATWSIPGHRTKNHKPHQVPLPLLAQDIIESVKPIAGCPLVFTTDGRSPIGGWSKLKKRLDAAMKIPPWRLHDLRRTAATGMAEIGIAPHIVEAALNHISGARAGVAGTYNRAAYAPEKRAALERWAAHIEGLVAGKPANVVALPTRKGRGK
jgi:integrase